MCLSGGFTLLCLALIGLCFLAQGTVLPYIVAQLVVCVVNMDIV